tara:strand:- start:119 stop:979 length:861 start_codon:yes stop_codon:yes gene_type:complete
MKKLNVEAKKLYYHGFVLNEQELRRFNDLIHEQIKKENKGIVKNKFSIVFENGVVAETEDIEEIFSIENSGSEKITELELTSMIEDERKVKVEFTNANSNNISSEVSINYHISGITRDWVFITSSLLEERIKKIKRWNVNFSTKNKSFRFFMTLSFPIAILIAMMFSLLTGTRDKSKIIENIRTDYESGKLTEPIEALLRIHESTSAIDTETPLKYALITVGSIYIFIIFMYIYLIKFYSVYNFCWGDYLESFRKKESLRKTVNTVIIIGLIVSIVGGIIANYIGK